MLQTLALALHPKLSDWWDTLDSKGTTPFEIALPLLCLALAYTQVFTNRSLLKRAHHDFST